jgi:hypothetical protein
MLSNDLETTCGIKVHRVKIANDMQGGDALRACELTAMFDQQAPNPTSPQGGFDKKSVELDLAVRARQHGSKARDNVIAFGNEHAARADLLERKFDGIGVGQQSVAVAGVAERCAPLQGFEDVALGCLRGANGQGPDHGKNLGYRGKSGETHRRNAWPATIMVDENVLDFCQIPEHR